MKNVIKGKSFADVEEVKQEAAEAQKGIKIDEFRTVVSSRKNVFDRCITSKERTLKVTEV